MKQIVGIDIGNCYIRVATLKNGFLELPGPDGHYSSPAYFSITSEGEQFFGNKAKQLSSIHPENTCYSIKKFLGINLTEEEINQWQKVYPFKLASISPLETGFNLYSRNFSPTEIFTRFIEAIKKELFDKQKISFSEIVLSVPDHFNARQREEIVYAAKGAGLVVRRLLNETTAGALPFAFAKKLFKKFLVINLGGGSLQISLIEVRDSKFEVIISTGNNQLGGDDLDYVLMEWAKSYFEKKNGLNIELDPASIHRLKIEMERAKIELSGANRTMVNLPYFYSDKQKTYDLNFSLDRKEFETIISPYVESIISFISKTLEEFQISSIQNNSVVLIGGQARIPALKSAIEKSFKFRMEKVLTPEKMVIQGLAIMADDLASKKTKINLMGICTNNYFLVSPYGTIMKVLQRGSPLPYQLKFAIEQRAEGDPVEFKLKTDQNEDKSSGQIGYFELIGLPRQKNQLFQVPFTIYIDENEIISVRAIHPILNNEIEIKNTDMEKKKLVEIDPTNLKPGFILDGRFKIVQDIGSGAFSYIYKIQSLDEGKIEALKILKPEYNEDETILKRFKRSAIGTIPVQSEYVVKVYELFRYFGMYCFRMEYIDGYNLEQLMEQKEFQEMPYQQKLSILLKVLRGMMDLKSYNIYHRDIKPANIIVDKQYKKVKLIDFELSNFFDMPPISEDKVPGTPRYMSPEHISKKDTFGDWSDIYSFGLICYKVLTGEFPKKAENPQFDYSIWDFFESTPIDPCSINKNLPKKLCQIILKCIQKKRSERYQSFEELYDELKPFEAK